MNLQWYLVHVCRVFYRAVDRTQWCICKCVYAYVNAIDRYWVYICMYWNSNRMSVYMQCMHWNRYCMNVPMHALEQILHECTYACIETDPAWMYICMHWNRCFWVSKNMMSFHSSLIVSLFDFISSLLNCWQHNTWENALETLKLDNRSRTDNKTSL